MDPSRGGDSRYNLNYGMGGIGLSLADQADLYGNPTGLGGGGGRPPSGGLIQTMGRSGLMSHGVGGGGGGGGGGGNGGSGGSGGGGGNTSGGAGQCQTLGGQSRGIKRANSDCYDDHHRGSSSSMTSQTLQGLESCGTGNGSGQQSGGNISDVVDDNYASMQSKKSPPANGKKTKGRVKIKMEYIDNKLRRYTTFSKRKTGIMKKAYELSTLTGTQVMLLVASETGHVYTFATRKLQPMITSEAGKQLIQTCLNSPDPPSGAGGGDQRMSATGFEETELSYNIADEDSKDDRSPISSGNESDDSSDIDSPRPSSIPNSQNIFQSSATSDSPPLLVDTKTRQQQQQQQQQQHQQSSKHQNNMIHSHTSSNSTTSAGHFDVLYPTSALGNLPQEVLLGLVQSGHLQLHSEEDSGGSSSGHQFITIPIAMTSGNNNNSGGSGSRANNLDSTNRPTTNSNCKEIDGIVRTSSNNIITNLQSVSDSGNGNKIRLKDTSTTYRNSTSTSATNGGGRNSPPLIMNDGSIRIKTEIIE